ncbi:DUF3833 domain-containing protein [Vibrio profundi]|uniref:DUF3833 domain-containing protein n=1 Tax=Vibrio profundi TaxID=1774960 RepID=UPI0037370D22
MKQVIRILARKIGLVVLMVLSGCSSELSDYKETTPKFDLFQFFEGETKAWGIIQDYSDLQTRRFEVSIVGTVKGNEIKLVEDFRFDDGEVSQRIWNISKQDDESYEGRADDIIGVAKGKEMGNALHWKYDFEIPRGDSTIVVTLDDWLYRQDETRAFNLTKIKKFGLEVGAITLFFEKQVR